MSDAHELILLLVLLYLIECCVWVRKGAVNFRSLFGRHCFPAEPLPVMAQGGGGILPCNPLPPFGSLFLTHHWPVAMSAAGVADAQHSMYFPFDEIQGIWNDQSTVLINRQPFVHLPTTAAASRLAEMLTSIWKAAPVDRDRLIDAAITTATDIDAAESRIARYHHYADPLRMLCHAMFFILMVLVPAALLPGLLRPYWRPIVAEGLVCLMAIIALFFHAHRKLFPGHLGPRAKSIATMILTPTAAVRACDALSRHLLEEYHPFAIASIVCGDEAFRRYARHTLVALAYPSLETLSPEMAAVESAFGRRLQERFTAILKEASVDPIALLAPPTPSDESCRSYCPRCESQFIIDQGTCVDCGLPVIPFSQPIGVEKNSPLVPETS